MDTKEHFIQHYHLGPQNHVFREHTKKCQNNYLTVLANELVKAITKINGTTQF